MTLFFSKSWFQAQVAYSLALVMKYNYTCISQAVYILSYKWGYRWDRGTFGSWCELPTNTHISTFIHIYHGSHGKENFVIKYENNYHCEQPTPVHCFYK